MKYTCLNCDTSFTGNYCNSCGQKKDVTRFSLKYIIDECIQAITNVDKGIFLLVKKLILDPGQLAYEYIVVGKRKRYFNLFTFFFLITAIAAWIESKELELKETLFQVQNDYGQFFNVYSKLLNIAMIPLLALTIWLLHRRKSGLMYVEYIVFSMVLLSMYSLLLIIAKSVNYIATWLFKISFSVDDNVVFLVVLLSFMAYANWGFHRPLAHKSIFKSLLVGLYFCLTLFAIHAFIILVLTGFKSLGIFTAYGLRISG